MAEQETKIWPEEHLFSINVPAATISLNAHAGEYILATSGPDATVEKRLEALESNVKHIHERIDQTQAETNQKFSEQAATVNQEKQSREQEIQGIRNTLEMTETGGLHISAMGALWLFVGVIFSSVSVELAMWVRG